MTLLRWLTFLLRFLAVPLTVLPFWIYFFRCWYLFCNGFSSIGKFWSYGCLSSHWLSVKPKTRSPVGDVLRDVAWVDIFSASAVARNFCEWVQVWIDLCIPPCKCQVKPHSSPWFSAACPATIVREITSFICINRINLLNLH